MALSYLAIMLGVLLSRSDLITKQSLGRGNLLLLIYTGESLMLALDLTGRVRLRRTALAFKDFNSMPNRRY